MVQRWGGKEAGRVIEGKAFMPLAGGQSKRRIKMKN